MRPTAALAVAVLLLNTMCASRSAGPAADAVAPAYTTQGGELPVGVIPAGVINDDARGRRIDLTIEYPIAEGSYPVIIFSTGFGVPSRTYVGLSSYWATFGYVVIKVGHLETKPDAADVAAAWAGQTPADWQQRVRDVKFVIDSLPRIQELYPELKGKMDPEKIGVGGHSYGAFVAMLIAGAKTFSNGVATSYADPRVKAVIAMSPQGPSESRGLTTESWREVRIPIMYMTGSSDVGMNESENEPWRRQAYELSPAGDKWWVSIAGAGHLSFTGRMAAPVVTETMEPSMPVEPRDPRDPRRQPYPQPTGTMPRRVDTGFYGDRQLLNVVRTVSAAFWDAYLKNEPGGREYLSKLNTRGDMTVETK
ncbi:MAG TPA: hypothetical protein VFT12_03545 [Thermoanaerobaculia bacterium]|nr:hypothetical protein [Thermoanaerobaculia bacterium]